MNYKTTRRAALKNSALLLLGSSALPLLEARAAEDAGDPHFFIFLNLFPGADPFYLFDSRSLAVTKAGLQQNYTGKDGIEWGGSNGGSTLASALTEPLKPHKDFFSVINGVHMSTFEGHDQNQSVLLTGSPFGGESFMPFFNKASAAPLDVLSLQQLFGVPISNNGGTLTTNASALQSLTEIFKRQANAGGSNSLQRLIASRLQTQDKDDFAQGVSKMRAGWEGSESLIAKMKQVRLDTPNGGAVGAAPINLQVIGQFFKLGLTRSLMLGIDGNFDTHGSVDAKAQPELFGRVIAQIAELMTYLKTTDFAPGKKLIDVTTFLIGSEFGRTMRQEGLPMDGTGTDHNPLNNSFIIGGKGVKGGQVVGASDLTEVDKGNALVNVSGAHRERDAKLLKTMGRPFDFTTFAPHPVSYLPATYDGKGYLQVGAVANTLYTIFGLNERQAPYRRFSQGGDIVPVLKPLLG